MVRLPEFLIILTYLPRTYLQQVSSYDAAKEGCRLNESSVASPTLLQKAYMADVLSNSHSYWLPIRRKTLEEWQWLNGQVYGKSITDGDISAAEQRCAVLRTQEQLLDDTFCYRPQTGFLCRAQGNSSCTGDCRQLADLNVLLYQRSTTWYQARDACLLGGSDLAVFQTSEVVTILGWLHQILNKQGHFWIGLSKERWHYDGEGSIGQHHWAANQPAASGDCAAFSADNGNWAAVSCDDEHLSLCTNQISQKDVYLKQSVKLTTVRHVDPLTSGTEDTSEEGSSSQLNIPLLIGALVALLFLVVFLVVGAIYIKRRCFTPAKPRYPEGIEDTDGIELVEIK